MRRCLIPRGKYLYFLSTRIFNPVHDQMQFDLSFPKGVRPYAITLRKDLPSPFVPVPHGFESRQEAEDKRRIQSPKEQRSVEPGR